MERTSGGPVCVAPRATYGFGSRRFVQFWSLSVRAGSVSVYTWENCTSSSSVSGPRGLERYFGITSLYSHGVREGSERRAASYLPMALACPWLEVLAWTQQAQEGFERQAANKHATPGAFVQGGGQVSVELLGRSFRPPHDKLQGRVCAPVGCPRPTPSTGLLHRAVAGDFVHVFRSSPRGPHRRPRLRCPLLRVPPAITDSQGTPNTLSSRSCWRASTTLPLSSSSAFSTTKESQVNPDHVLDDLGQVVVNIAGHSRQAEPGGGGGVSEHSVRLARATTSTSRRGSSTTLLAGTRGSSPTTPSLPPR